LALAVKGCRSIQFVLAMLSLGAPPDDIRFYMGAFFVSYQIATLFADIRLTLGPVRDHILNH
jgi:hypothetical protein